MPAGKRRLFAYDFATNDVPGVAPFESPAYWRDVGTGAGAHIRRAIIDQDNHVPPGERIVFDLERDRQRFHVSDDGIVVVGRNQLRAGARAS